MFEGMFIKCKVCAKVKPNTATQLEEHWDRNTHIQNDASKSHVCYGTTGQWTETKGSRSWTAALMKGVEGHSQAYVTHTWTHTCPNTHTLIKQCSCYMALFGLFIWIQEKGKGLCISHCAHKGSCAGPEPVGVSPKCVCVCVWVCINSLC